MSFYEPNAWYHNQRQDIKTTDVYPMNIDAKILNKILTN